MKLRKEFEDFYKEIIMMNLIITKRANVAKKFILSLNQNVIIAKQEYVILKQLTLA